MLARAEKLAATIPTDMLALLNERQLARIKVMLVRTWRHGYKDGYRLGVHRRRAAAKVAA